MSRKNECKIVQDLLPNYVEGLTNEETNLFIEEHLRECNTCKKMFNNMKTEIQKPDKEVNKNEVNYIKKYNININENMNIDDILDEIEAKMFEMGFEENDEINKDGIELERLYDNIFHNNKEV